MFSNTLRRSSSLDVRHRVSQPYSKTDKIIIEMKTYLGAQSKNFVGIELDRRVTLGS